MLSIPPLISTVPKVVGDNDPRLAGTTYTTSYTYFVSTGTTQTFVVPAGVTSVLVKEWGGGGGGGVSTTTGGGGGYTADTLPVQVGEALIIIVGGGGSAYHSGINAVTFGGGGNGYGNGYNGGGSGGGGRSEVQGVYGEVIAGGGGGGGQTGSDTAGAGGGLTGQGDGGASSGGTQTSGGTTGGSVGSKYKGGDSVTFNSYYTGGGGGGGWYGGGSGAANDGIGAYSGAGGSGHLYSSNTGTTIAGNLATPGNSGDAIRALYLATAGNGGVGPAAGVGGLVYLQYNIVTVNPPTVLQLTASTTPTANGQMGRRADGTLCIFDNNILKTPAGVFRSYTPSTVVANTTVNTTNGQLVCPAGTFDVDHRVSIAVFDSYTNSYSGSATDNATLTINVSNTALSSLLTICTIPVSFTSATPYESSLTCKLEGVSRGTSQTQIWTMETTLQDRGDAIRSMFTTTLDDSRTNTLSFLWQWGTASTTNSVTPRSFTATQIPGF